jgi:hypothetical protein
MRNDDAAWIVRLPARIKPAVEAIARQEDRPPTQVVRRLLDAALAQRAIAASPRGEAAAN